MNYAEIEDGVVSNIVFLHPSQEAEFPNCVQIPDGALVEPGDVYLDGKFYRDSIEIKSTAQRQTEVDDILNIILGGELE